MTCFLNASVCSSSIDCTGSSMSRVLNGVPVPRGARQVHGESDAVELARAQVRRRQHRLCIGTCELAAPGCPVPGIIPA